MECIEIASYPETENCSNTIKIYLDVEYLVIEDTALEMVVRIPPEAFTDEFLAALQELANQWKDNSPPESQ